MKKTAAEKRSQISLGWQLVVAAGFLLFFSEAHALTEKYIPTAWDYIFYTFAFSGVLFSAALITAYRQFKWLVYVFLAFLLLINNAAMDGMLALVFVQSDFVIWVLPYLLTSGIAAYGFFMITLRLEEPHRLARLKKPFLGLALISASFPLSSYFWLGKLPLSTMWLPVNVLFFMMVLAQILPPITWRTSDRLLRLLTRAFPLVVGLFATGVYLLQLSSPAVAQSEFNNLYRIALLIFAFFSLTIVIWQAIANTREKKVAERQALEAARNEAEMRVALMRAEQDYEKALSIASSHHSRLASVSHDLKQPIAALRMSIDYLQREKRNEGADKLARAVDYIDGLAHSYIDEGMDETLLEEEGSAHAGKESVATSVFAGSLRQMFSDQAREQRVNFKVIGPERQVTVEPLATMRIMTNLISNALAHAKPQRVLVGFRPKGGKVVFQVHDDGCGMDDEAMARVQNTAVKGDASEGHGLGLGIVRELCQAQGMPFYIHSLPGRGTSAYVEMG